MRRGRIQGDLYAFNRGDAAGGYGARATDKIWELFDHYIIADDVEMTDVSDTIAAVGLTGPESRAVLERAGISVPELAYMQFAELQWQNVAITVLRAGEEVKESWQLWVAPEHVNTLWDALVKAGAKPTGSSALNLFRISRGIPQFGRDIRDRDLPGRWSGARAELPKAVILTGSSNASAAGRCAPAPRLHSRGSTPEPAAKFTRTEKKWAKLPAA
jgi:glycine cleavage system aminomethyltransferase T